MVKLISLFFFVVLFPLEIFSIELNPQERQYFNFIDLNNDSEISFDEIIQSLQLVFQLIDKNQDGSISQEEIIELKNIIESLS
jgi:Ca2+-binding EF-hand superfamily protein